MNWKLRGRCYACKRTRWFVSRKAVYIPQIKQFATARDFICGQCAKHLQDNLNNIHG